MQIQVFVSESRISKQKFVEELKPKQRLEYLSKYPKSSFHKITDKRGKITEGKPKPKKKLSGKPRAPKSAKTPVRQRSAVSKVLQKKVLAGAPKNKQKTVQAAMEKVNAGTANKRNLATLKNNTPEELHGAIDKAFATSQKRASKDVESRRKQISKPTSTGRKSATKRPATKRKASPKKKTPAKNPPVQDAPEKPETKDVAKVVQQLPKQKRGSVMASLKRVFTGKQTEQDVSKLDKLKKDPSLDKTSRQTLDKLKRYAEAGVVGKKEAEAPKVNKRKKLTKKQMFDRIRDKNFAKITEYREKQDKIKSDYMEKAQAIAKGKGTKAQRQKKIDALKVKTQKQLKRNATLANNLIAKTRDQIQKIKEEKDRKEK